MQVLVEIDEQVVSKVDALSKDRAEYFQKAIQEKLLRDEKILDYEDKLKRTLESYKKTPQQPEEYEIWLDEQVWEE